MGKSMASGSIEPFISDCLVVSKKRKKNSKKRSNVQKLEFSKPIHFYAKERRGCLGRDYTQNRVSGLIN